MKKENCKGIWIFAEQTNGVINPAVFELLAKAQELKAHCGEEITAVLLGSGVAALAASLIAGGADKVIVAENEALAQYSARPYQKALAQLAEKYCPSILMYASTAIGRDVAPRLMISLNTGLTADAIDLGFDEDDVFYQVTPGYGGKILAHIVINERRPQMVTVRPQMFEALTPDASRTGEVITESVDVAADTGYEVISTAEKVQEGVPVDKAAVLVSGGIGIRTEADLKMIKDLAAAIGGEVCGTRPLIESGLLPHSVQIGQSGATVKPEFMLNIAISGSVQYKVGMQGAKDIMAINKDPKAAIFGISQSGAVADYRALVPAILAEIKKRKA